jgi:hypothetical protein
MASTSQADLTENNDKMRNTKEINIPGTREGIDNPAFSNSTAGITSDAGKNDNPAPDNTTSGITRDEDGIKNAENPELSKKRCVFLQQKY